MRRILAVLMTLMFIIASWMATVSASHTFELPSDTYVNGSFAAANPQTGNIIDTNYGLTNSSNRIRINLASSGGLQFSTGSLSLKAADATLSLGSGGAKLATGKLKVSTNRRRSSWKPYYDRSCNRR